ncbi:MAG TPA: Gfo/Idh/MocA family oxidoreductase [Chloroflexota bacterium]|nr:Gfo/Idh/MocA family oxidoreductase [Chloroflexota bacterium]
MGQLMTRIALIDGAEVAAAYLAVAARLPRVAFTAVIDRDPATARRVAGRLGVATSAESFGSLLERDPHGFDAVLIHGSDAARVATIERAAKAGKHVLAAAPLAESVAAAERVINICRASGVTLMVGHAQRFVPSHQAVKAALDSGKLGEPGLLRVHRWAALADEPDATAVAMREAVDGIDLAHWIFAALPNRVYAVGHPGYAQIHLGFPNGGMAILDYATNLPEGDGYTSLSLIGSTGAAYADDHHNRHLLFGGGIPRAINGGEGSAHLISQLAEFVSAIEERREPAISGDAGKAAIQVAEATVASLESRRALRLSGGSYELA